MFKRFTIGWKILSGLGLLLLLVISANYVIFATQKNRITENTFNTLSLINNTVKIMLLNTIEGIRHRTADFSSDGFIRDATKEIVLSEDKQLTAELGEHLRKNKQSLDPSIYGINILDTSGVVIASTDPDEIGRDESMAPYYIRAEDLAYGTTYVSDFLPSNHFHVNTIALVIAAPLTDKANGRPIGTLMNFIRADSAIDAVSAQARALTDRGDQSRTFASYILNRERFIVDKAYMDGSRLTKQMTTGNLLQCGETKEYSDNGGASMIGSALCLMNGWMIITEIPATQAFAPITNMRKEILLLVVALATLILIIMYLLTRLIIDPIKTLSTSALQIGKGNFGVHTDIESKDELGDLSQSFNEMAESLRDKNKVLADKIKEVTGDLEKFKLAVEGALDHIIITDKEGMILYANKAAEETTGYSREEMLGNRPSLWGKQMPAEFYRRMWRTVKEEKKSFHGEITNKRKNGQLYIAESHISPIFDDMGGLYGFVGVERDITRQKEIDKAKTEFVSIASHQLRTPLTIINWYVEMLTTPEKDGGMLSEKQRQYLEEVTRASKRMIELVNALLNVSRIDMGTFMVDVEPVAFATTMDDVLKDLIPQVVKKGITIKKNYDATLPQINADPKLLRMVFQNLITNAVKYTSEKGAITIDIKKQDLDVLIVVADTGMGIPAEQQSKIFSKFFRADNARAKEPDGNGLGLYIIKSLVEHSGGKIWFDSIENKGTTFYIALPLTGMKAKEGTRPLAI